VSDHELLREQAALHLLGALEEDEAAAFEAHLAGGCRICEGELAALRPAIDALAEAVAPLEPSPELRVRVLRWGRGIVEPPAASPSHRRRRLPVWAAVAAVALGAALGALGIRMVDELQHARESARALEAVLASEQAALTDARAQLATANEARAQLAAEVERYEDTFRVLTAPATRALELEDQDPNGSARARAYVSPETGTLVLYAYGLPPLPEDRVYQAWVVPDGPPLPAGLLAPSADGVARHEATNLVGLDAPVAVTVTIEPAGGGPAPSGPTVLAGR
jgi:anti-sigma-K factor RskA